MIVDHAAILVLVVYALGPTKMDEGYPVLNSEVVRAYW